MQMHWVAHVGGVGEDNSDAFTSPDIERVAIRVGRAIDLPNVLCHVSTKRRGKRAIEAAFRKRIDGLKPLFLSIVQRQPAGQPLPVLQGSI